MTNSDSCHLNKVIRDDSNKNPHVKCEFRVRLLLFGGLNRYLMRTYLMQDEPVLVAELKHLLTELVIHHVYQLYVCQPKIPESLVSDSTSRLSA